MAVVLPMYLRRNPVDQFLQFAQPLQILPKADRVALDHVRYFGDLEVLHEVLQAGWLRVEG